MENSSFGRLVGVLVAPTPTFQAIAQRPTWAVALLVLLSLAVAVSWISWQRIDMAEFFRESAAQSGRELGWIAVWT